MKPNTKSFFILQLLVLGALLLLTLLALEPQVLVAMLTAGLILLWLASAVVEPFSLLLSALALSATTSTLSHLNIDGVPFSVNGLLTAGLGAACGLAIVIHFRQQFRTAPQLRRWLIESAPLSLLLAWALVRIPSAPVLSDAISDVLIWSAVLALYVLARAYWIANPQALTAGEKALFYVAFLTLAAIVVDALLGNVFFNTTDTNISFGIHTTAGSRTIPAFFGLALVPLLARLRFGTNPREQNRWLLMALIATLSLYVYFSLARTALLGTAGIVFPLMLLAPRSIWKAAIIVVAGLLVTAAVIQSPLYPRPSVVDVGSLVTVEERGADNESEGGSQAAIPRIRLDSAVLRGVTFGRSHAWQYLLDTAVSNNPVVGLGTGASRSYVTNIIANWDNPHSDYVRVFFDLGAIGLLIFVLSWAVKALTLWQRWMRSRPNTALALRSFAALTATGYVLLNAATDNTIVYFFLMGPLSLMLAMADATTVHAEARLEPELAQPVDLFSVAERLDQ